MAASNGRKTTSSGRGTSAGRAASTGRGSSNKKTTKSTAGTGRTGQTSRGKSTAAERKADTALYHEIGLIVLFVAMVILFCCNFGIIGPVGDAVSGVLFGVFGLTAYAAPVAVFVAVAFRLANEGNPGVLRRLLAGAALFIMVGIICELAAGGGQDDSASSAAYSFTRLYERCRDEKTGGGVLSGSICYFLKHYLETIGTVLVVLLGAVVSLILLTEKSLIDSVRNGGSRMRERGREEARRRREYNQQRREQQEELRLRREEELRLRKEEERARREEERTRREEERQQWEEEKRLRAEEKENEKILRMEKRVTGVMLDTALVRPEEIRHRDDVHEIILTEEESVPEETETARSQQPAPGTGTARTAGYSPETGTARTAGDSTGTEAAQAAGYSPETGTARTAGHSTGTEAVRAAGVAPEAGTVRDSVSESMRIHTVHPVNIREPEPEEIGAGASEPEQAIRIHKEGVKEEREPEAKSVKRPAAPVETALEAEPQEPPAQNAGGAGKNIPRSYMFPPLSRLQKGAPATGDSEKELTETARRLEQTLKTFGVKVTITDISQGPSVTRYELQPEQGVKVSKIVGLSDDIKLNLAATDIRIEAPIPGKAAIGIEVPNKETMPVALRDLLESREFKEFPSNLAFAVGKDIAGKVVVSDIAKMPHMLIAGATGSGKSVCINTLIMSILYKAHPDDVKLIMVDPKVVELSVYNGIPHLLIPVVTDPKKASAALHWGVSEMEDRYRKFADFNVRDLKGYNQKAESMQESGAPDAPKKLPQIVIIVDELADLMMVCPGEVEESICRLAQLARAAGIHLIIATQRPSVDVITGLIKANMPSRVAFSVSSGVDSRTILDMNGAEKLLGKGDMLFYPQGYSKPARIQGAFVSDKEVSDVVDFLKNQTIGNTYAEDIEDKISKIGSQSGGGSAGGSELDELFEKAGRLIIEQENASIGYLQRAFKIGFNRAARIMDQLSQYGVVSEAEGTKPRKILMGPEQFEQLVEESL